MTTPHTHESTAHVEGEDDQGVKQGEWRRMVIGFFLGVALAALVWFLFPSNAVETVLQSSGADPEEEYTYGAIRAVAAVTILMGVWWMTEAIPLAATALLPLVIFPLAGVGTIKEVGAPYASATIFLFMGGFLIALALQRWNLHRRMALTVVKIVGTSPKRLVLGFMLATGFLSMWVSNTATAVVMLPIGTSVLALTAETVGGMKNQKKFATALMLGIAYSASIGSLGTLIGTPPNALLAGYMKESHDIVLGFGKWMIVGMPLAIIFLFVAWFMLITIFKPEMDRIPGGKELIDFAPAEHGIIIDGKSLSAQEVDELRPQARTQLESARQWAEEKYGVAPAVPVNYQEGPYYGTIDADLPEFVLRACGEIYEVSGELPAGKRAEFLDARYCKDDPRGAWLSLHGKAGPNGFVLRPNFAYRPAWSVQPSPQQWAADIETFPRTAEWIPDWLVIQLQEAQ